MIPVDDWPNVGGITSIKIFPVELIYSLIQENVLATPTVNLGICVSHSGSKSFFLEQPFNTDTQ